MIFVLNSYLAWKWPWFSPSSVFELVSYEKLTLQWQHIGEPEMWDKILTNEIDENWLWGNQIKMWFPKFEKSVRDVLTWTAKGSQKKRDIIQRKNTWGHMVMIITSWYRWPLNCQKKSDLRQRQRPGGGCYHNVTSGCIHEQVFDDIYIMMMCLSVCLSRKMITSSWESPVTTWTTHNHPLG